MLKSKTDQTGQPLIDTLHRMLQLHEQLVETATRKRDLLIHRDVDGLSQLLQEESKLVKELAQQEEARMADVEQLIQDNGAATDGLTFKQVIDSMEDVDRHHIGEVTQKLEASIAHLKELNDLNMNLLQDSLDFVNHSIELLTAQDPNQVTYGRPEQTSQESSPSTTNTHSQRFFDTKA